jgi:hypothetical protein
VTVSREGKYLPIHERQRLHAMQRFRERYDGIMSVNAYLALCEKAAVIGPERVLLRSQGEHQILALKVAGEWLPVAFDLETRRINSFLPYRALREHRFVQPEEPAAAPKKPAWPPFPIDGEPIPFLDFAALCPPDCPTTVVGRSYQIMLWLVGKANKNELTKRMKLAARILAQQSAPPQPADICRILRQRND